MNRSTNSSIFGFAQDTTNAEINSLDSCGENHTFSKADERNHTRCMFCSAFQLSLDLKDHYEEDASIVGLYQLLHDECSTCRPSDDSETQLCDFCRHIRMRHFLSCIPELKPGFFKKFDDLVLDVDLGDLEAIKSRQNCSLCRLVADAISIHGQEAPESNRSSITNFVELSIELHSGLCPLLWIKSNLLKAPVSIARRNLRPSNVELPIFGSHDIWTAPSGEEISWDRVRKSLPDLNPSPIGRLPSNFRLIDVLKRRCVTVGPFFNGPFAALSYVWGSAMGAVQAWSAADVHNPPNTIEDALHACQQLGQKYLWVDQICINQDDPMDKANQIASMAAIYSSASLVIVAAGGENVHSGISGMHLTRRRLQARGSFLSFEFASVPSFKRDISSSIWSTRGWTFQEVVLSKTKLYFSPTGLWIHYEADRKVSKYSVDFGRHEDYESLRGTGFPEFCNHLRAYSSRKLTHEYDIYNAFSGIITALFGGPDRDIYGLPEQYFDRALLWVPSKGGPPPRIRVIRNDPDRDPVLNPPLPTWSWASLTGEVEVAEVRMFGGMVPLVKWARIAPSSQPPTPILIEPQNGDFSWGFKKDQLSPRVFLAVLWSYSCFDSPSPFPTEPINHPWTDFVNFRERWPSPQEFWHEVSSRGSKSLTYPGLNIPGLTGHDDYKIAQLQPGLLLTRAQVAHVWVDPNGYFRDDDNGALIGRLYGGDRGLILQGDSPKVGVFKCVAISVVNGLDETLKVTHKWWQESGRRRTGGWPGEEEWYSNFDYIPENVWLSPPVVNVMLIGREGLFSYRLGIGWVLFRRWIDAKRVFETILLK